MANELRNYFYSELGGFASTRAKNKAKDYPFELSDYKNDVNDHVTYVQLNVIDNSTLKISFYNNLEYNFPYNNNLIEFLKKYEGKFDYGKISIIFDKNDLELIKTLRSEFDQHYSKSPNYAWVKNVLFQR